MHPISSNASIATPSGYTLTFTHSVTPNAPWINFNNEYDEIKAIQIKRAHLGIYTVTVTGTSASPAYIDEEKFKVFVMDEDAPTPKSIDDMTFSGNRTSSKKLSDDPFYWPNGYVGQISIHTDPATDWITYDISTNQIKVDAGGGDTGTFKVYLTASDYNPSTSNTVCDFRVGKLQSFNP